MPVIQVTISNENMGIWRKLKEYYKKRLEEELREATNGYYYPETRRKHRTRLPKANDSYVFQKAIFALQKEIIGQEHDEMMEPVSDWKKNTKQR